jgi:predicted helicase
MRARSKGIISARDDLAVDFDAERLKAKIRRFIRPDLSDASARLEFFPNKSKAQDPKYPAGDSRGWKLPQARLALRAAQLDDRMLKIAYRPFDFRTIFDGPELVDWGRPEITAHFAVGSNIGLSFNKRVEEIRPFTDALVFDAMIQHHSLSLKEANDIAPLYLDAQPGNLETERRINFDPKLYAALCKAAGIDSADTDPSLRSADAESPSPARGEGLAGFRAATGDARPSEVKVFDYIYGVLHSPAYRETFAEFLKIDFPRIPYPASPQVFAHVSEKGEHLRRLHLMEPAAIGETPYAYHGDDDDVVASGYPKWEKTPHPPTASQRVPPSPAASQGEGLGRVYINPSQYFADVPEIAWGFHIGGYQPAQK